MSHEIGDLFTRYEEIAGLHDTALLCFEEDTFVSLGEAAQLVVDELAVKLGVAHDSAK